MARWSRSGAFSTSIGAERLRGATLYTTGEPCVMCMGAILWCRIPRAGLCRVGRAARHQDRPDHDVERGRRRHRAVRADLDHRRRAGGRGDGAVQIAHDPEAAMIVIRPPRSRWSPRSRCSRASSPSATSPTTAPISPSCSTCCRWIRSFRRSTIRYRAITSPALHHAAYAIIIAAEALTAVLCWIGACALLARQLRADARTFNRAKTFAVAGPDARLSALAGRLHVDRRRVVRDVAVEAWNGVPSAFRFVMVIMAVLIFVAMPDGDLDRREP